MKWVEILRKDNVVLLQSENDTQYVVATGYDPTQPEDQQWVHGWYYPYFDDISAKPSFLMAAIEYFRVKTEKNYISRSRLEELATLFKDGLVEDDKESAMEYFEEVCEMDKNEKEFFGIGDDE